MTPDEEERALLERRAAQLARVVDDELQQTFSRVAVVTVGTQVIGVPAGAIAEVVRAPAVAPLANLPPWIRGVFQHRGELVTAVDLGAWIHGDAANGEARRDFVVMVEDGRDLSLGLFVESVVGFREIRESEVATLFDDERGGDARPITAITRDLVALLDLERIFNDPELGRSAKKETDS